MRSPTGRDPRYGTECSQSAWHRPPITSRSPAPGARSWVAPRSGVWAWRAARAEPPRPAGAEGEHGDDRVVEPAHVGVAMERLAVVAVAVERHAEAVEPGAMAVLEPRVASARAGWGRGRPGRHPAESRRSSTWWS